MTLVAAAELRTRWRAVLLLALLVAAWSGAGTAAAAGARRGATAIDRFQRVTASDDASFSFSPDFGAAIDNVDAVYDAIRTHPGVADFDVVWFATTGLAFDDGIFVTIGAPVSGRWGTAFDRPIVLAGRMPKPERADEVVVSTATAQLLGVELGDRIVAPTWDRAEYQAWQLTRGKFPAFGGPRLSLTVVGVVRQSPDLEASREDRFRITGTPALYRRWRATVGENGTQVAVKLAPGASASSIAADVTRQVNAQVSAVTPDEAYVRGFREAAATASLGLWALAATIGASGLVLVGLAIVQEVRQAAARHRHLAALGATRPQQIAALSAPSAFGAAVGLVSGLLGAIAASRFFPIGVARLADPFRGVHVDWVVVVGGVAVVLIVFAGAVRIAFRSVNRRPAVHTVHNRLGGLDDIVGPSVSLGMTSAIASRDRRLAAAAIAVTVAGLVASTWLAGSARQLDRDPTRWGFTFSAFIELNFAVEQFDSAVESTADNPAVLGIAMLRYGRGVVDDAGVDFVTFDDLGGRARVEPRLISGRLPAADAHELALGERTARTLGVSIGDTVDAGRTDGRARPHTVVGIVIVPATGQSRTQPGDGAYVSAETRAYMGLSDDEIDVAVRFAGDTDAAAVESALFEDPGWLFLDRGRPRQPASVSNRLAASTVLPWLAGFFLMFGCAAVVVLVARRPRPHIHDLACLRAVGFTRGNVRWYALSEGLILIGVGATIGTVAGVAVARAAWDIAFGDLGVYDAKSSVALPAIAVVGAVGLAVLLTALRSAGRVTARAVVSTGGRSLRPESPVDRAWPG